MASSFALAPESTRLRLITTMYQSPSWGRTLASQARSIKGGGALSSPHAPRFSDFYFKIVKSGAKWLKFKQFKMCFRYFSSIYRMFQNFNSKFEFKFSVISSLNDVDDVIYSKYVNDVILLSNGYLSFRFAGVNVILYYSPRQKKHEFYANIPYVS